MKKKTVRPALTGKAHNAVLVMASEQAKAAAHNHESATEHVTLLEVETTVAAGIAAYDSDSLYTDKEALFADVDERVTEILEDLYPARVAEFQKIAYEVASALMGSHQRDVDKQTAEDWKRVQEVVNQTVFQQFREHNQHVSHFNPGSLIQKHRAHEHGKVAEFWGDVGILGCALFVIALAIIGFAAAAITITGWVS